MKNTLKDIIYNTKKRIENSFYANLKKETSTLLRAKYKINNLIFSILLTGVGSFTCLSFSTNKWFSLFFFLLSIIHILVLICTLAERESLKNKLLTFENLLEFQFLEKPFIEYIQDSSYLSEIFSLDLSKTEIHDVFNLELSAIQTYHLHRIIHNYGFLEFSDLSELDKIQEFENSEIKIDEFGNLKSFAKDFKLKKNIHFSSLFKNKKNSKAIETEKEIENFTTIL